MPPPIVAGPLLPLAEGPRDPSSHTQPPVFKVAVPLSRGASDASSAWETVEPTPKPRSAREASASKRVPRTVDEEDSWEASPQHPGDRHRRRRSVSQAVTQARWASPASDLTDSPSAAWSGTHMREEQ